LRLLIQWAVVSVLTAGLILALKGSGGSGKSKELVGATKNTSSQCALLNRASKALDDSVSDQTPEPQPKLTQPDTISELLRLKKADDAEQAKSVEKDSTRVASPAVHVPKTKGYTFANLYAAGCIVGAIMAVYLVLSNSTAYQFGVLMAAPTWPKRTTLLLEAALWTATGLSVAFTKRIALALVYTCAITGGIGVLMRGIVPLDLLLYTPTILMVFYLRKRRSMLE